MTLEQKELSEYRNDKKYIPILLTRLHSESLKTRAANEVCTYVYSACKYKRRFLFFTFLSIALPAIIVMLNSMKFLEADMVSIAVSLLSTITIVVTGIMNTLKANETWIRNREYAERAKAEIFNCIMGIGDYKAAGENQDIIAANERKLAERLEALFAEERGQWKDLRTKAANDSNTGGVQSGSP